MILSVPSYVIPGTYAENVELLASRPEVQGIELLFYLYDADSRALLMRERGRLLPYRERFSFSVHMPDPLLPAHEELLATTQDLADRYVIHPPASGQPEFLPLVRRWRRRYGNRFLLENLVGGEFDALADTLRIPICCDTGHLLLRGASVGAFMRRNFRRISEIHLHGVENGLDHHAFGPEERWFADVVPMLKAFEGVLHLEVFSLREIEELLTTLRAHGMAGG